MAQALRVYRELPQHALHDPGSAPTRLARPWLCTVRQGCHALWLLSPTLHLCFLRELQSHSLTGQLPGTSVPNRLLQRDSRLSHSVLPSQSRLGSGRKAYSPCAVKHSSSKTHLTLS